jgi:hypothetical protein
MFIPSTCTAICIGRASSKQKQRKPTKSNKHKKKTFKHTSTLHSKLDLPRLRQSDYNFDKLPTITAQGGKQLSKDAKQPERACRSSNMFGCLAYESEMPKDANYQFFNFASSASASIVVLLSLLFFLWRFFGCLRPHKHSN